MSEKKMKYVCEKVEFNMREAFEKTETCVGEERKGCESKGLKCI